MKGSGRGWEMVEKGWEKQAMGRAVKQGGGSKDGGKKQETGSWVVLPTAASLALSLLLQGSAVWVTARTPRPGSSRRDVGGPLLLFPCSDCLLC